MGNKTFAPNASVTRAQVVQMFYNLLKDKNVDVTVNLDDVDENKFDPERPITRAEFTAIATRFATKTAKYGWIKGMGDGTFRPNEAVTRAQAATIVNAMLKRFADKDYVKGQIQNPCNDVTDAHWAFYQIMEASVAVKKLP